MNLVRKSWGLLLAVLLSALMPTQFLNAQADNPAAPGSLDLVILVDESSSLSNDDVKAEIRAVASLISRRELSSESLQTRVVVAGFGSGSSAIDEKCPPAVLTTENVKELVSCTDLIRRRSTTGQATDFAQAFSYASSVFRNLEGGQVARVVILLTDGKYDPRGVRKTSGLSGDDIDKLESAVSALRMDGAQIWPLGFGQVSENELNELAAKGAPSSCPSGKAPSAVIAQEKVLSDYLLEILGAAICAGIEPPQQVPYDFQVHPFVNEVTLTIRGTSGEPSVVVASTKKNLCTGEWKQAIDGSLACRIEVTGEDSGVWTISAVGTELDVIPTVETSQSGRIDLRLSECGAESVLVSVSRTDNSAINWSGQGFEYPKVSITDASSGRQIGSLTLSSDQQEFALETGLDDVGGVGVTLESSQSEFVWLTASTDTCDLQSLGNGTEDASLDARPEPILVAEEQESGGSQTWPLLLIPVLLALVGLVLWRKRIQGRFPDGAELRQRNVVQNPAAKWNTRADLSGQKEAYFSIDGNGWLIETSRDEADLIVRRSRPRSGDDFLVIQPPSKDQNGISTEGAEVPHVFSIEGESGTGISFRNTYIRVEVPQEPDDEDSE